MLHEAIKSVLCPGISRFRVDQLTKSAPSFISNTALTFHPVLVTAFEKAELMLAAAAILLLGSRTTHDRTRMFGTVAATTLHGVAAEVLIAVLMFNTHVLLDHRVDTASD